MLAFSALLSLRSNSAALFPESRALYAMAVQPIGKCNLLDGGTDLTCFRGNTHRSPCERLANGRNHRLRALGIESKLTQFSELFIATDGGFSLSILAHTRPFLTN
jgi:hypothetical protein